MPPNSADVTAVQIRLLVAVYILYLSTLRYLSKQQAFPYSWNFLRKIW